jgi:predicted transcriptional regulator
MSTISIRIDDELKARLEARAKTEDRSLSAHVVRLIRLDLEENPTPPARRPKK